MAPMIFSTIKVDPNNITAYDANNFAYYSFYNRLPTSKEQDKFNKVYNNEKLKRGIRTL